MYTYNKWKYLSSHGWDIEIYYTVNKDGRFFLKELEIYKDNYIPDLIWGLSYISERLQEKILDKLLANISKGDEVVVEGHLYNLTQWGELIAKKTGGINIMNCLEENLVPIGKAEVSFLEFKLKRHEILNASSVKSLHRYFGSYYKDSYEQYIHNYMRIYCSNVVTHSVKYENSSNDGIDADYKILSVGRLNKPYVLQTFAEVKTFIEEHSNKKFRILVIGESPQGKIEENIKAMFRGMINVRLVFLGYMFPVPYNLIEENDVAIASANSVLVPSNEGIPTIAIDTHDLHPIGIYGKTTNNRFSRDNEPIVSVVELLEDVLIKGLYPKSVPVLRDESAEMEEVFSRQIDFLRLSPRDGVTYPVNNMFSLKKKITGRVKYYLHRMGF